MLVSFYYLFYYHWYILLNSIANLNYKLFDYDFIWFEVYLM